METPICQVAISVVDLERSISWYQNLGFESSGSMGPLSGEVPARLMGVDAINVTIHWILSRDPMTQFEVMRFDEPTPRDHFAGARDLRHAGYGLISIVIPDHESTVESLKRAGSSFTVTGARGSRSIWTRDPDGIAIEIMERDPLGSMPSASGTTNLASIRSVTITVESLDKASRFWSHTIGATPSNDQYSMNPIPSDLRGGVEFWDEAVFRAGTMLVRIVKPQHGFLPRPSDYRLPDLGIINIAAMYDSRESLMDLLKRMRQANCPLAAEELLDYGEEGATMYGHDDQGISIEMGFVAPGVETKFGWRR